MMAGVIIAESDEQRFGVARYLVAALLSRTASAGGTVVFPILAIRDLHDVGVGALLVAASLAPSVVIAPLAGALLDSTRRPRLLFVVAGLVSAVGYATGALLGIVPLAVVVIALLAAGCATPFVMGGMSSFVTSVIAPERTAFATDTLAYGVSGVGGPALSAVVIAVASPRAAALTLATASALGALAILSLQLAPHRHERTDAGLLRRIATGTGYLVRHRPLFLVTASSTLTQVGAGAFPIAAIALAAQRWQHADEGAWIVTAFSVGSLASAVVVSIRPIQSVSPAVVLTTGFALAGALIALSAIGGDLVVTLALVAVAGVCSAPSAAALFELRTVNSPLAVRAQVFTVGAGLRAAASAAGAAIIGPFAGADAGFLVALVGVGWVASAAIMLPYRAQAPAPVNA